jgi:hypothetical protein
MNGWAPNNVTLPNLEPVGPSSTKVSISKKFPISASGSKYLVVAVQVTQSGAGTCTLGFKTSLGTGVYPGTAITIPSFETKTATFTATGQYFIRFNNEVSGDQAFLPLLSLGEVILTTPAGVTVTVNSVQVLQED